MPIDHESPRAWLAWLGLHLLYLMGFRNRMIDSLEHPVVVRLLGKKGA